jgi:hypothetical protein
MRIRMRKYFNHVAENHVVLHPVWCCEQGSRERARGQWLAEDLANWAAEDDRHREFASAASYKDITYKSSDSYHVKVPYEIITTSIILYLSTPSLCAPQLSCPSSPCWLPRP